MEYDQRSSAYRSLIDPESGYVRPRTNGDFYSPYNPREVNNHFTEANAFQYSFSPVHDIEGWIEVLTNYRGAREDWNNLPRKKQIDFIKPPMAKAALIAMPTSANRKGLRVSSRAKYNGCKSFCSTKAGKPNP